MRKLIQSTVMGLVMLATALTLQAGSATLMWDYDYSVSPDVTGFKVYCAPGTNTTWQAGNTNATKTTVMPYTSTTNVVGITYMVGGLSSGPWTFTVTALGAGGAESDNATTQGGTNVWAVLRPGKPVVMRLNIP
ncbi:MAG: hypothetical protein ACOYB3_01020 [Azonexus sp.]